MLLVFAISHVWCLPRAWFIVFIFSVVGDVHGENKTNFFSVPVISSVINDPLVCIVLTDLLVDSKT